MDRALRAILRGEKGFQPVPSKSKDFGWSEKELKLITKMHQTSIFDGEIRLSWAPLKAQIEIGKLPRVGIEKTRFADELLRFIVK